MLEVIYWKEWLCIFRCLWQRYIFFQVWRPCIGVLQ